MNKLMSMAAMILLLVLGAGCQDDDMEITLLADKAELEFSALEETMDVNITCNVDWSAVSNKPEWCTLSAATGTGNGVLSVNVSANETSEIRTAVITVAAGDEMVEIQVKQAMGGVYEILIPDFSESFVYNIMDGENKVAELCREAIPGGAEAVVTLYLMENGEYPETGYVVSNGGSIKHDGTGYTPGTLSAPESIYLVQGKIETTAESAVPADLVPDVMTDKDENTYKITKIGAQYWTAENYRCTKYSDPLGMPIAHIEDNDAWNADTKGAYRYYEDDQANADVYGFLYNGYALRNGSGFAPEGWTIPRESDMKTMLAYLGGEVEDTYYWTTNPAYLAAEETWDTSFGATNTSGFSVLAGGYYDDYSGFLPKGAWSGIWVEFDDIDYSEAYEWGYDAYPYLRMYPDVQLFVGYKMGGCYVRFVRDSGNKVEE